MELKTYQKEVIQDLEHFLELLQAKKNISQAFEEQWAAKGVPMFSTEHIKGMKAYKNNIPNCPHVCIKVPTAGGKTFIASNALHSIFHSFDKGMIKAVIWLVPSNTILQQTEKALKDPNHPYRQRINTHFGGRVEILNKADLLQGKGLNPTSVRQQLTIMILSMDSFRSRKKADRLIYRENSAYQSFFEDSSLKKYTLEDEKIDEMSLMNVIRILQPVVIIDESHRAESDLSVEVLQNLNPSFVLDLTATPRNNSNIISIIGAHKLKAEKMVKLPIIVYNQKDATDVINSALVLQRSMELEALKMHQAGAKYIRPIVLFQAEPKAKKDTQTFEKIKKKLIEKGIEESKIAIKTANVDELKGKDLMSPTCEIRYIITVNALKEGWDCPFAYILATIANKSSVVDVEQILGRVLRLPYVQEHPIHLFNSSYVLTCSNKFKNTLDGIVNALNMSGFSGNDYRVANETDEEGNPVTTFGGLVAELPFGEIKEDVVEDVLETLNQGEINTDFIKSEDAEALAETTVMKTITQITVEAQRKDEENRRKIQENKGISPEIAEMSKVQKIQEHFRADAEKIILPQFFTKAASLSGTPFQGSLLGDNTSVLFQKEGIISEYNLSAADANIDFDAVDYDVYQVDLYKTGEDEYIPKHIKINSKVSEDFVRYISDFPEEKQAGHIAQSIVKLMGRMSPYNEKDLVAYVKRIILGIKDNSKRQEIAQNYSYIEKIKTKIKRLTDVHLIKEFRKMIDTDEIITKENYKFPNEINPTKASGNLAKSLYEKEAIGNPFEEKLIMRVAGLENLVFWHRLDDKKKKTEFHINGYINHYPDYFILLKSGYRILIETKGSFLDGSDSKNKLELGKIWAAKSSTLGNQYNYFMVFEGKPMEGGYTVDELIQMLEKM